MYMSLDIDYRPSGSRQSVNVGFLDETSAGDANLLNMYL